MAYATRHPRTERSTSVMMLNMSFKSMVMSSVACECSARSRPRWPSSRPCQCSVPQPSWPSLRLAILARRATPVVRSRFGYFEPVICHTCSLLEIAFCAISEGPGGILTRMQVLYKKGQKPSTWRSNLAKRGPWFDGESSDDHGSVLTFSWGATQPD